MDQITNVLFLADAASYSHGVTLGSVVAGAMGGILPLIVGLSKRRPVWALTAFFACVGCGLFLGLILAGPVGLLSAVAISNLPNRRRRY